MKSHKFGLLSWHYVNCHLCAIVCLSGCGIDFTQLVRNDKLPHMHIHNMYTWICGSYSAQDTAACVHSTLNINSPSGA